MLQVKAAKTDCRRPRQRDARLRHTARHTDFAALWSNPPLHIGFGMPSTVRALMQKHFRSMHLEFLRSRGDKASRTEANASIFRKVQHSADLRIGLPGLLRHDLVQVIVRHPEGHGQR